jgi:Sulfotransferase family
VIGCPRSGTTLLYHMLLSAGGFAYYRTETHVFNSLAPRCGDLARRPNRQQLLDLWLASQMHARSGLDADAVRALIDAFRTAGGFLQRVMDLMVAQQGVMRWAETTPAHLLHMAEIHREIPDALFVHVIRDGRDVAASLEKQRWVRPLPWDRAAPAFAAGAFWQWITTSGRRIGAHLGDAYCEVRYEDLVATPQAVLDTVGAFIGQGLDHGHILAHAVGSVARPNTSFPGATQRFTGRWREAFAPAVGNALDQLLAPTLRTLGYETSAGGSALRRAAGLAPYRFWFSGRQWVKMHTPLGRRLTDLSLFAPVDGDDPPPAPAP